MDPTALNLIFALLGAVLGAIPVLAWRISDRELRAQATTSSYAEAAVVPVEDDIRGQEIRACIVRAPGAELTADDVFEYCGAQLAPFKVPRYVEFRDELPHTPTFKIQKEPLVQEGDRSGWVDRLAGGRAGA